uniref:Uncharacterized protein n=2 Tax=Arion vulgaris TaxID=1028688 RepID=A0A0B7BGB9_9EUPU
MPFKLFQTHKKSKKEKSEMTYSTETSEQKSEESPDIDHKTSNKGILHFFSSHKGDGSHVQIKSTHKEKKVRNNGSLLRYQKTKSMSHLAVTSKECGHSDSRDHPGSHACSKEQPRKSASYGTFMDSMSHERRLMEIAQLDTYMEYLRRTEDEGNLTNRLCCAQVLKMSLLRLEQRHMYSLERIHLCHKGSMNHIHSQSNSSSRCRQKRLKDVGSFEGDNSSTQSESKDGTSIHVTFSSCSDSDGRESERDSSSEQDSDDNSHFQDNVKTPEFTTKAGRTPIPVWPRDIEIF